MRVTFVAYDDTPPLGGQGVMLAGMRNELQRRGMDVETISGRGDHAVRYPRVSGRGPLDLSLWLNRHPRALLKQHADVIHAHGGPGGVLLLRRLTLPLVYTAHHTYRQAHARTSLRRALAPLEARAYRQAGRVLAVSRSTADAVRAMNVPSQRIEVLPPGITIPHIDESLREPGRMLFVGRLEPEKGALIAAVDVMLPLLQERPGRSGAMIGGGTLMQQIRAALQREPRIEVLGRVDDDRVRREFQRASVVVMPSDYEGLGLVALEAQANGAPVVGYDVTGLRDAVRDGGVLVAHGDVTALRDAARGVVDDNDTWSELSRHGRDFVAREHSWDVIGARLVEIYRSLR